jgi:hypothetical protein
MNIAAYVEREGKDPEGHTSMKPCHREMLWSQELLHRAERTVLVDRRLAGTIVSRSGTSSSTPWPLIQRSVQNKVEASFSTFIATNALKKAFVMASSSTFISARGLLGVVRWCQNQRSRSAQPINLRSITPNPPSASGRWTLPQTTKHCAPWAASDPDHRKHLKIFMHDFSSQGGRLWLIAMYVGMAVSVILMSVRRPLQCMKRPFQAGSRSAILFASGWRADLGNLPVDKGIPIYWIKKIFDQVGEQVMSQLKLVIITPDRDDLTFADVAAEARRQLEQIKYGRG